MTKKKPRPGRTKARKTLAELDHTILDNLLVAIKLGAPKNAAAAMAGITAQTLDNWLKRGAEGEEPFAAFKAQFDVDFYAPMKRALITINRAALEDARHAEWLLERRYPKDFGLTQKIEQSGEVTVTNAIDMSPFQGRTLEEKRHYLEHGVFPDGTKPVAR